MKRSRFSEKQIITAIKRQGIWPENLSDASGTPRSCLVTPSKAPIKNPPQMYGESGASKPTESDARSHARAPIRKPVFFDH